MKHIAKVNQIFFITVILALTASLTMGRVSFLTDKSWLMLVLSQGIYVLPTIIYLVSVKENPIKALRIKKINIPTVVLLILFSYFILPFLSFLNSISLLFSTNQITSQITGIVAVFPVWISVLLIGVLPAVLEESVYRGVFYYEYGKVNRGKGILLSGLLFGLMHMNFNQFVYAVAMGIIFALLVEVTDSLLSSVIVHGIINSNTVIMTYLFPEATDAIPLTKDVLLPSIMSIGSVAVFTTGIAAYLLWEMGRQAKRSDVLKNLFVPSDGLERERMITIPLVLGMAGCVAIMLISEVM